MGGPRAWSFLTTEGESEYQGHQGYEDEPRTLYRYDNFVANHRQVSPGDIAIIRTTSDVIGIAEIEDIVVGEGTKERYRCPVCSESNLSNRKTMIPAWRCKSGGHEFDQPVTETVPTTTYAAYYGSTFCEIDGGLDAERLAQAVVRPSDQMSIKEIDLAIVESNIRQSAGKLLDRFASRLRPPAIDDPEEQDAPGSLIERRNRVLRQISIRRGQKRFREKLIKRYGGTCQVTGCEFLEIVEAAHIDPYSESENNAVGNGLLLRSDIHTLFDLGYIGIEPENLKIELHPSLEGSEYQQIDGAELLVTPGNRPDASSLEKRWAFFRNFLKV